MTRLVFVLIAGLLLAACSNPLLPEPGDRILIDFDGAGQQWPLDHWDLQAAHVEDAWLELTVAYGGGCQDHDFWLVAVDGWIQLPTAGPTTRVAVPLLLAHDVHHDPCDAYLMTELSFDLRPLQDAFLEDYGAGPADILLRVPMGQGSADTLSVTLHVPTD